MDFSAIRNVRLGDVVETDKNKSLMVRGKVLLTQPIQNVSGFVLLGELKAMLVIPDNPTEPLSVYALDSTETLKGRNSKRVLSGSLKYYSPHFSADDALGGQLNYSIFFIEGMLYPAIMVYRDIEIFCFLQKASVYPTKLNIMSMDTKAHKSTIQAQAAWVKDPTNDLSQKILENINEQTVSSDRR